MKKTLFCLLVLLIPGCAYLGYLQDPWVDIPNLEQVNATLYRGGQPTPQGFRELQSLGIRTVISLKGPSEELAEEKALVRELGLGFYSLPMSVYLRPDDTTVLRFLEIVLTPSNQPIFVHCESGRDRTGAMIALYRVVVDGWSPKPAYTEAKQLGFWPYHGDAELKKFILQIKDKPVFFNTAQQLINDHAAQKN